MTSAVHWKMHIEQARLQWVGYAPQPRGVTKVIARALHGLYCGQWVGYGRRKSRAKPLDTVTR